MSYEDGWAALNLEMPPRVPRTEYSAHGHWDLVNAVTGSNVTPESPPEEHAGASRAFVEAWNYDYMWSTFISRREFKGYCTDMGHAEYASGGTDRRDTVSCPFSGPEEALALDPAEAYGPPDPAELKARYEDGYRKLCDRFPNNANSSGIYITLISGLIDIFGWEIMLTALGIDPEGFGALANRYASWIQDYFNVLAETDIPLVMVHDDIVWTSGPFCDPAWYREYVFPNYRRFLAPLREAGKKILYTSDGNYTMFIDDIAAAGVDGFVMEPTTDMAYIAEKYGKTHSFIGNADTRILLNGTREDIRAEVQRCMDTGKNCPGFFMAVGNHIPSNTPVENAIYYNEVYEELAKR
ncbi:MAG: uroporphyrinogen decarboxylase family protein [Kiritimatiellia bacterium]